MITLKTLLDQLQDTCHCTVRKDYDTTRFISRIDILRGDTILCGDTLYLCPDDIPENLLKPDAFSAPAPEQSPTLFSGRPTQRHLLQNIYRQPEIFCIQRMKPPLCRTDFLSSR